MSTKVVTNGQFTLNGTARSTDVASATLNVSKEMLDETAWGDSNRINKSGLGNWDLEVVMHQDYATVDAQLYPILGTTACFELRPDNSASTGANPIYSGLVILESYAPISGGIGSLVDVSARFRPASSLARNTSAT